MTLAEARNILSQPINFGDSPDWRKRDEAQRVESAYRRLLVLDPDNWEDRRERDELLRKFPALRREV